MTTTHSGVDHEAGSLDDAANSFLNQWLDAGTLSKDDDEDTPPAKGSRETEPSEDEDTNESDEQQDDAADDQDESTDQDDADEGEPEEETAAPEATDDHLVKVTIDGETRSVSVKDLKRLYGQEASLTRKSQEVAQSRKNAEDEGARYTVAMQALVARAEERFKPYKDIDWLVVQGQLDPADFAALRAEARQAHEDVQFLQQGVVETLSTAQKARQEQAQQEAKEAWAVLEADIPDWSAKAYDTIRSYGVEQGLEAEVVAQITSPAVIKLLRKAMLYDAAQKKVATTVPKVVATKKAMKPSNKAAKIMGKPDTEAAMKRLKTTGSAEDAANAFLDRWAAQSND